VTRRTGAKTASVLPKKRKLLNTAPQKSATDLQKKRQLVLFKPKKSANSGHPADNPNGYGTWLGI